MTRCTSQSAPDFFFKGPAVKYTCTKYTKCTASTPEIPNKIGDGRVLRAAGRSVVGGSIT